MNVWIFQGNPKYYRITDYLRDRFITSKKILWSIKQYKKDIKPGDKVYIWRAKGNSKQTSGIIALGEMLSKPAVMEEDGKEYILGETRKIEETGMRVKIKLIEIRLTEEEGMISRSFLKEDPILKNELLILRRPNNTNYKLTPQVSQYLEKLWKSFPKNNLNR